MNNSQIIYSSRCTAMQNRVFDPTSCGQHKEATACENVFLGKNVEQKPKLKSGIHGMLG